MHTDDSTNFDRPNAIERLQPTGECDVAMHLRFLNTLSDIVEFQKQNAWKYAIDPRYNACLHFQASIAILLSFYDSSFMERGGTWIQFKDFFAIFPKEIPICYGAKAGGKITLGGFLKACADNVREHVRALREKAKREALGGGSHEY